MTDFYAIALTGVGVWCLMLFYIWTLGKAAGKDTPKQDVVKRFEALPPAIDVQDTGRVVQMKVRR